MPDCSTAIEIVSAFAPARYRHALFDFDGTLSLIRQGWQDVMVPMMVDILMDTPRHEPEPSLTQLVRDFVDELTGKQTIYQMLRLAKEVRQRGGTPWEALAYKRRYLDLLWDRIEHRVKALKTGERSADDLLLPGSIAMLELLSERGVSLYLASGTDIAYVRDEAEALGIAHLFTSIHGAIDDWRNYSKAQVIQDILRDHDLSGDELLGFGDGYVEIENTVAVGGTAIGVASDETHPHGIDQWKRSRLIRAGAQIIIPDFGCGRDLVALLFPES